MIIYNLLVETKDGFVPALDGREQIVFEAETTEQASAILEQYQSENGKCFAAEVITE